MKHTLTLLGLAISLSATAQNTITNGSFENWESLGTATEEPTGWNSNKTGGGLASSGPQTCFQSTDAHSGSYSAKVQTTYYIITVVNGNLTTGKVQAPSANKAEGFIEAVGANKMSFTGRPDSLVGWYKYTQATSGTGATAEQASIKAHLHTGDYYDPIVPVNGNHPDASTNGIATATFISPAADQATWTRFSVPFVYANNNTPAYIMMSLTSSANQNTVAPGSSGTGSILLVDDISVVYNNATSIDETYLDKVVVSVVNHKLLVAMNGVTDATLQLQLTDLNGRAILKKSLSNQSQHSIDLPSISSGMYLYQLVGKDAATSGKLMID